jgi:hypothetical protein
MSKKLKMLNKKGFGKSKKKMRRGRLRRESWRRLGKLN